MSDAGLSEVAHGGGPPQKPEQFPAVLPHETAKLLGSDPIGVPAPVCFDAPPQVRTAPGPQAIASGGLQQEREHYFPPEGSAVA